MIWEAIEKWASGERAKLEPMNAKQKWEYIWEYYKWWIFAFFLLIYIIVSGVQNYRYQSKQELISGMFINTVTTEEGYSFVKEGYWQHCGGDENTRVELIESRPISFNVEQPTAADANAVMSVDTQIAARTLDYIICDAAGLEFYGKREVCLDLREFLTEEQLANLTTAETPDGLTGIDISDSRLAKEYGIAPEPSYILFLVTTQHVDNCGDFVTYLFGE